MPATVRPSRARRDRARRDRARRDRARRDRARRDRAGLPTTAGRAPWMLVADLAAKALLVGLLLFAVTHTDWDRFADKAMTARLIVYPLVVGVPALVWWLRRSGRPGRPYPAAAAFVFTLPFVIDCLGNTFDLYDRVDVFDDVCHFVNWAMLCTSIGLLLIARDDLPPWAVAGLCVGFGAASAILWEVAEYGAFITKTPERFTLYRDTIGDLTLGLTGSIAAGLLCGLAARRSR